MQQLPELSITVQGLVTKSNFQDFKNGALAVFNEIKTDLVTDDDFNEAESTVKWIKDIEDKLQQTKSDVINQMAGINEIISGLDEIKSVAANKRLTLDKLVKSLKETRKQERVNLYKSKLIDLVDSLQGKLSYGVRLQNTAVDFDATIKGLKTLKSVDEKLAQALSQKEVELLQATNTLLERLAYFEKVKSYHFLFNDISTLIYQLGFIGLIDLRISEYEDRLAAERAAAERDLLLNSQKNERIVEQKPINPTMFINDAPVSQYAPANELPFITKGDIYNLVAKEFSISCNQAKEIVDGIFGV